MRQLWPKKEFIVDPPMAGEVRVKVMAIALYHTDITRLMDMIPKDSFLAFSVTKLVASLKVSVWESKRLLVEANEDEI